MNKQTNDADEIFEHNGKFYFIKKQKYEVREAFIQRVWYILTKINDPDNTDSFDEIKRLSLIWSNVKNMGCEYSTTLHKKIN